MVALAGTYKNGKIKLDKEYLSKKTVKVIVTFLEEEAEEQPKKRLTINDFHFLQSQKELEHYKGSLSDALIEERRSEL